MSYKIRILCGAASMLAFAPASAAPTSTENMPASSASGSQTAPFDGVQDIVVTARRTNESAQTVPLAISIIGADKIRDANVIDIVDVARLTPNFNIRPATSDPSSTIMTIRGQAQQDSVLTTDSPIGIYVDGVNYIRSSNLGVTLVDVERVEVLKGPQGTLFGKNTTGGAINIATRQPDLSEIGGYIQAVAGNYDRREISAVINAPLVTDRLGLRILALHREQGGVGRDSRGSELASRNEDSFRAHLLFKPNDSFSWTLSGDYTHFRGGAPVGQLAWLSPYPSPAAGTPNLANALLSVAVEAGLLTRAQLADRVGNATAINAAAAAARALLAPFARPNGDFYDSFAGSPQGVYAETYGLSSSLSIDLLPNLQVRSITAARWLDRRTLLDLDTTPYSIGYTTLLANARNLSQELQLSSQGNSVLNWIAGLYVNDERGLDKSISRTLELISASTPGTTEGRVRNGSWAVFGQAVIAVSDDVRLTAGLRWTEENRKLRSFNRTGPDNNLRCSIPVALQLGGRCEAYFKDKFSDYSYLASIDWKAAPGLLLYGRTARGFKGGGQNLRGAASTESFLPFKPEILTDYEIGMKGDFFRRRLRINADVFTASYSNIQRTILIGTATGGTASLITNAAKARVQGAEIDISVVPVTGLVLGASGAVTDAKYKKFVDILGDRSNESFPLPKYSYSLSGTYDLPTSFGSARFSVNYTWADDTDLGPTAKYRNTLLQRAYGLIDARLAVTVASIDTDIALFGKNIADKKHITSGLVFDNSLGYNVSFAGPPRVFGIEVKKRFGGF